jgi:NAD(P)-dependent dehydrogenase (short-subunit alcohol dehydrogenase family)
MDLGLKGKKAIVTGATKGIGRRIAELFADEGVDVAICARDEDEVAEAVEALKGRGVNATGAAINVRDGEAYQKWLAEAAETLGGCDIFVPNVSAGGGMDSEKNWWKSFEIDVLGTVRGVETLMPRLEASDAASVVIISSTNALEFFAGPMAYNAMKAALINYAKQLAVFVGGKGIRVNSISPGPVYFSGGAWEMIEGTMPDFYKATVRQIPSKRMGSPEEVARVVAFVASPAGSLLSGANIVADNGFTRRVQY